MSQHLKVLKDAGLVQDRKEGVHRVYRVELRGLVELRRYVDDLWNDVLVEFQRAAGQKSNKR